MLEELGRELPPAALLLGPDLEQMVWAARTEMWEHGVLAADRMILRHVSAADARTIVRFAQTAPFGPFKLVIAALDGATSQAQNILLKVLEEPPPSVRFILAATQRPLPTIVSRCQVVVVPEARAAAEPDREVTAKVDAALRAAAAGDLRGLDQALHGWGEVHHAVLESRLTGIALSGDAADERWQARRLLGALARFGSAHPRLAAHAALVSVLADRTER